MRETLSAVLFVFVIENNCASFAVYVNLMINKVHSPCSLWLLQSSGDRFTGISRAVD